MDSFKNKFKSLSNLALVIILIVFTAERFVYFENNTKNGYNATSWDALGYYLLLPGTFIYKDVKQLNWFHEKDSIYSMSGGTLYQICKLKNGNYTFKYLIGVSIIESPYFFAGHLLAKIYGAPQDGFSWPYQYSIMFGAILWFMFGLFILKKILLHFFDDIITSISLLLLCLTSNLIQYVSIDGAMSHSFIFTLYAIVLWYTVKWHENPETKYAFIIGLFSGLAIICRPTELIIIFIPILWKFTLKNNSLTKWQYLLKHKNNLYLIASGGLIGVMPQLVYWKYSTGSFIYDVGSKWVFLTPWWRVLFGPEKGWFLYTTIAIFMIIGFFFMDNKPFKKAVITFCLLNIWVIISWFDWRYGASYSTRALSQSYPVFALPLASFIYWVYYKSKFKYVIPLLGLALIWLNFLQLSIYNKGILENFSLILKVFH